MKNVLRGLQIMDGYMVGEAQVTAEHDVIRVFCRELNFSKEDEAAMVSAGWLWSDGCYEKWL